VIGNKKLLNLYNLFRSSCFAKQGSIISQEWML